MHVRVWCVLVAAVGVRIGVVHGILVSYLEGMKKWVCEEYFESVMVVCVEFIDVFVMYSNLWLLG